MTAVASRNLPQANAVAEVLTMLFGEDANVAPADKPVDARRCDYGTDEDRSACVMFADNEFATYSAAKLLMVPAGRAKDMAAAGERTDALDEGFAEIANISATLFQAVRKDRLSLTGVDLDDVDAATGDAYPDNVTYKVDVPGYGPGHVTFLSR